MKNLNLLSFIFVILKLTGTIDWSWWAVFSPTLLGLGLIFLAAFFVWLTGHLK